MEKTSIVIPYYNTPQHLDLCLGCLGRFTEAPHETLIVDNGSDEAIWPPLRQRYRFTLLKRRQDSALDQEAHKAALDLGISQAAGRFILALHSDTFVIRRGYLRFLIERLLAKDYLAYGPSTHRLYPPPAWEKFKNLYERKRQSRWIRPVFTIYRAELFRENHFTDFNDVGELTELYVKSGRAGFLSREEACQWAFHLGGTTKLHHLQHRPKAKRRKDKLFRAFLAREELNGILQEAIRHAFD